MWLFRYFYALERPSIHLTVCCWFLNKFWMGGGGVSGGKAMGPSWRGRIRGVDGENKRGGAGWLSSLIHPSSPSRVIKFLYSPAPPPPTVWALDLPRIHPIKVTRGLVCIKHPMHLWLYSPMLNILDVCISNTWGSGRVGPWNSRIFGPQMVLVYQLNQCGGSGMFIPDPGSWFLPIPDPGSQIQKQQQKTGVEKKIFKPFFVATNFTKLNIILFLICWIKKFGIIFKELLKFLPKKLSPSPQKYWFGIRDPRSRKNLFRIPDPGSRGQKGTGSRIRIRNTGLDAISQGPKNSRIPGPNPFPLPLVMDMHVSKTLCTGLYVNHRCINS